MDNSRFKFRAWYPVDQQMTYSDQSNWGAWGDCEMSDMVSGSCEIMQFTGLHDKNGKEVYEGDILKVTFWDEHGEDCFYVEVAFKNGSFVDPDDNEPIFDRLNDTITETVIIGNIHEHPNLLKP